MPIKSGCYIITNVRQRNLVTLRDPNDGTSLAAGVRSGTLEEQWLVELHSNGTYSIKNVMHENSFANAGHRAGLKAAVEGERTDNTGSSRELVMICTTDTGVFWALEDRQMGTPITLLDLSADQICWWSFESAVTGAPADVDEPLATQTPKRASTVLRAIFSPLRKNRHKHNPKFTLPSTIVTAPSSSSQLNVATLDPVVPDPLSSSQPTSDAAVILLDIPFTISESNGLLDPLSTISQALEKVFSAVEVFIESDEEWRIPIRRLRFHLDTIKYHRVELESDFKIDTIVPTPEESIIGPLEEYAKELRNIYRLIGDKKPVRSSILKGGSKKARNEETIGQRIGHMDSAFEDYTAALHSFAEQAYKKMQELSHIDQNLEVEVLEPHFTHSKRPNTYGVQHKECLRGTRQKTLKAIREWANDISGAKPTFLLLDLAGSGKSTVAKTMAEELRRSRLVARYFFSRDTTTTRSTESFCSTVSNTFIRLSPALKPLVDAFKRRSDVDLLSFKELFNGLVTSPLEELSLDAILIIDALDECNDEDESCTDLLEAICSQRSSTPRLRILATGRPELHITRWAKQYNIEWHNFVRLEGHDKDVNLYIEQMLQELPGVHAIVKKLANGLFIWARIACHLLLKTADVNRLLKELETAVSLDYLYKVALDQSVPKDEGSRRVFVVVLQMILAAREPLSIAELERLAPEPHIVEQIVSRLGALLVYKNHGDPIRLLHATFREFLTRASKADSYFIQLELGHHTLTLGCLKHIKNHSAHIPCDLDNISQRVYVYSSKSWVHHCTVAYRKLASDPQVLDFCKTDLQNWADSADEWEDLDTISCLRDVLNLSRQDMLPEITETMVDQSLETVSPDGW